MKINQIKSAFSAIALVGAISLVTLMAATKASAEVACAVDIDRWGIVTCHTISCGHPCNGNCDCASE